MHATTIRRTAKLLDEFQRTEVQDSVGRPVPQWLFETFMGRYHLGLWITDLNTHLTDLGKHAVKEFGRDLPMKRIRGLAGQIMQLVSMAMPYSQCDCELDVTDCPRCKGSRWYTKTDLVRSGNALQG